MNNFQQFIELKNVYNYLIQVLNYGCPLTIEENEFYNLYCDSIPIIKKQHLVYFNAEFNPFTTKFIEFNNGHLIQLKKIISLVCYQ